MVSHVLYLSNLKILNQYLIVMTIQFNQINFDSSINSIFHARIFYIEEVIEQIQLLYHKVLKIYSELI